MSIWYLATWQKVQVRIMYRAIYVYRIYLCIATPFAPPYGSTMYNYVHKIIEAPRVCSQVSCGS